MSDTKKLRPCPFCGTEDDRLIDLWDRFDAGEQPKPAVLDMCHPNGLMFDAFGEPRTRYVRVTLDGNHCVMHHIEGDSYLKDARDCGDEPPYVVADVYLSEREFNDLPEHYGF